MRDSLFTLLEHPEAPPDSNGSERDLRPLVVYRKVTGGFRSAWGPDLCAAILLRDVEAPVRERARAGVLDALRPYARGGRVELGPGCWLFRAVDPAAPAAPDREAR